MRFRPRLFTKFLLVTVPLFALMSGIGAWLEWSDDLRHEHDRLSARIGQLASRTASVLARNRADTKPDLARDLLAPLAADPAVTCVALRSTARNLAIVSIPRSRDCTANPNEVAMSRDVGIAGTVKLHVMIDDSEVVAAASHRLSEVLLGESISFIILIIASAIAFRIVIGNPIEKLLSAIRQNTEQGHRRRVDYESGDQIGELVKAFKVMLALEVFREGTLLNTRSQLTHRNKNLEREVKEHTKSSLEQDLAFRHLIECMPVGIYVQIDGIIVYANKGVAEQFGCKSPEEMIGIDSLELFRASEWEYIRSRRKETVDEGKPLPFMEAKRVRRDGSVYDAQGTSTPLVWGGEPAILVMIEDISKRKHAERALIEQQRLMASLLETTHEGFWFIDADARTTDVNPAMCMILGRPREEILGKDIYAFVDAENEQIFRERMAARKRGEIGHYQIALQRPDGSNVPCLNNATPIYAIDGERIGSVGIWAEISEIKAVQLELERASERAQAANVAKSEFLATVSHELRTPMNGVIGMAWLLLQSEMSGEQRHRVERIQQCGEVLLSLLNDILDISKIESGRFEIEKAGYRPRRMIEDVTALMEAQAEQKGLAYRVEVQDDLPEILIGDVTRVRQVLPNLTGNALKFTERGHVAICVTYQAGSLGFAVADSGIGIESGNQARIFEKFTQADASTSREFGGTGLGLSICKELVRLMGGEIGLHSTPGEGSTFRFSVPCAAGTEDDLAAEPMARDPGRAGLEAGTRRYRILVAEDNVVNQEVAVAILEGFGHRVDAVDDGARAVDAVRRRPYDAILMDIRMPGMDGLTATSRIRALAGPASRIPIIALTADAMESNLDKYLSAGFDACASKPFDADHLLSIIDSHVAGQAVATEAGQQTDTSPIDVLDAGALNGLRRDGRNDMTARICGKFLEVAPGQIADLGVAIGDGDLPAVKFLAHKLKSGSAYIGAMKLSLFLRDIETMAEEGRLTRPEEIAAKLRSEFLKAQSALQDLLARAE